MHRTTLVVLCLACVAMLVIDDVTAEYGEMLAPPPRPAEFTSADQLRNYLAALNEYYSIMGRPRFGKRSSSVFRKRFASLDAPVAGAWEDFQQWRHRTAMTSPYRHDVTLWRVGAGSSGVPNVALVTSNENYHFQLPFLYVSSAYGDANVFQKKSFNFWRDLFL